MSFQFPQKESVDTLQFLKDLLFENKSDTSFFLGQAKLKSFFCT